MSLTANDQIKSRVLQIFPDFVSDVDPDKLSDHLIANKIINTECWKRIRAKKNTQEEQCRELLLHLNSIKNPRTFIVVREAVEKICPHICEEIEHQTDTETGVTNEISAVHNDQLPQNITCLYEQVEKLQKERDEAHGLLSELKGRLQTEEAQSHRRLEERNAFKERLQMAEAESQRRLEERNAFKERLLVVEAQSQERLEELTECKDRLQAAEAQSQERLEQLNAFEERFQTLETHLRSGTLNETKDESQAVTKIEDGDTTAVAFHSESFEMSDVRRVFGVAKLGQSIYILCEVKKRYSFAIRVFEYIEGYRFVNEISLNGIRCSLWDLVPCDKSNCLFFTDCEEIIWKVKITELSTNDHPVEEWLRLNEGSFCLSKSQDGHLMVYSYAFGYPKVEIYDVSNASFIRSCRFSIDTSDGSIGQVIEKPNGHFIISRSLGCHNGSWAISELDRNGNVTGKFIPSKLLKLNNKSELHLDSREDRLFVGKSSQSRGVDLFDANSLDFVTTLLDAKDIPPHEGLLVLSYDEKNRQLITCSGNRVGVYELCW